MKSEWLINKGSDDLILFFAGWSMDANPFQSIPSPSADVMMFYDYRDMNFELPGALNTYKNVSILAWSLGIAAVSRLNISADQSLAISGTPYPADDQFGIPTALFDATIESLSIPNLAKFYKRMCKDNALFERFIDNAPDRKLEDMKDELVALRNLPPNPSHTFNKAIVCTNDSIVPTANQLNCWKTLSVPTVEIDAPHFPFYSLPSWEAILDQ